MARLLKLIDNINEWVGRVVSYLIFPIIGIVIFEVVIRNFHHKSQLWVPEISVSFLADCLCEVEDRPSA
jgi:TRAP-type mannitol/chloroaromatic compound transport system permease small subunit